MFVYQVARRILLSTLTFFFLQMLQPLAQNNNTKTYSIIWDNYQEIYSMIDHCLQHVFAESIHGYKLIADISLLQ